mmetsp:Transcript_2345/g.3971  ORF Transcript_2345/g.3971 Transcript_2345/m.3971 type:complete len:208 (+) Transcript_2345:202-825(+)
MKLISNYEVPMSSFFLLSSSVSSSSKMLNLLDFSPTKKHNLSLGRSNRWHRVLVSRTSSATSSPCSFLLFRFLICFINALSPCLIPSWYCFRCSALGILLGCFLRGKKATNGRSLEKGSSSKEFSPKKCTLARRGLVVPAPCTRLTWAGHHGSMLNFAKTRSPVAKPLLISGSFSEEGGPEILFFTGNDGLPSGSNSPVLEDCISSV